VPHLNIAVAPFTVTEANGVRVNALPGDAADAILETTTKALRLLETWTGPCRSRPV
jgi:hypothetical protein